MQRKQKTRNNYAKALERPEFRQKKIKSAKGYDRNHFNSIELEDDMAEDTDFNPNDYGSICGPCVTEKGGSAIEGHVSTHWAGKCSVCGSENVSCNDVWDWKWPHPSKAPYWD